jgi:hypothetical protein
MAFRQPPPEYYVPPKSNTTYKLAVILVFIVLIIVAVVALISIRKLLTGKCTSDLDCLSQGGRCQTGTGTCIQCLSTADCGIGLVCSTAGTCV